MSAITTHVLDTSLGRPAAGVQVVLEYKTDSEGWQTVGEGTTDSNGRIIDLLTASEAFPPGHYRLAFEVGPYYLVQEIDCFFPQVTINFVVVDADQHYHVPLLVSPFGYSTYRGS